MTYLSHKKGIKTIQGVTYRYVTTITGKKQRDIYVDMLKKLGYWCRSYKDGNTYDIYEVEPNEVKKAEERNKEWRKWNLSSDLEKQRM